MQERQLYEYAVLRVVPRVEREEFLNIGVIVYCSSKGFLQAKFVEDCSRLHLLYPDFDTTIVAKYADAVQQICKGRKHGGFIGTQPASYRFRWLTANRSTIIQSSQVHPGLCIEPEETLEHLFDTLVL